MGVAGGLALDVHAGEVLFVSSFVSAGGMGGKVSSVTEKGIFFFGGTSGVSERLGLEVWRNIGAACAGTSVLLPADPVKYTFPSEMGDALEVASLSRGKSG